MLKKHTFFLCFSQSVFYLIKMYERILGRRSAVPERLGREGVRSTRKVGTGGCPQYQKGWDGRVSAVPQR
jgi:hypothetical protein